MRRLIECAAGLCVLLACGCTPGGTGATGAVGAAGSPAAAPAESAEKFVARVNKELTTLAQEAQAAGFTQDTFITPDTELLNARATERYLAYLSKAVAQAKRYDGGKLSAATARAIMKLRLNVAAPAPDDPVKRARLTQLEARLEGMYGEGKYCPRGPSSCKNLDELSDIIATSRNYEELTDAWKGWHGVGAGMREDYTEFVQLANEGARELGFKDLGVMWRAGYDMSPGEFDAMSERLWTQVKPLYDGLQCYARARLAQRYGEDKVPAGKPIPAQLLGNMWAQQWSRIYPDILKPYPAASIESADARLKSEKWDAARMTHSAESFYTSLGFPELPRTFWERSMLTRPRDREVVCHASAWDMAVPGDVRVKACLQPTEGDLYTIYHELGHVYYYMSYANQPYPVPRRRQRRLPRGDRRHHQPVGDARVSCQDRAHPSGAGDSRSAHQPADEDGAGEDRLPALRPPHRPVALEGVLG